MNISITHFEVQNLPRVSNDTHKLKSGGGITIKSPIVDWAEGGISIEVHCDAWGIMTKKGSTSRISNFRFPKQNG